MQTDSKNDDPYFQSYTFMQKIESHLAFRLGLEDLRSRRHVIRNEKGWRDNEKELEYVWLVQITRSFVGWGILFTIRFNECNFRDHKNPTELIQGLLLYNQAGEISELYFENVKDTTDQIANTFTFNPFQASRGISLDGVGYDVRISARNIDTFVTLNNPNTAEWKTWEKLIWQKGSFLAQRSGNKEMMELFQ